MSIKLEKNYSLELLIDSSSRNTEYHIIENDESTALVFINSYMGKSWSVYDTDNLLLKVLVRDRIKRLGLEIEEICEVVDLHIFLENWKKGCGKLSCGEIVGNCEIDKRFSIKSYSRSENI